MTAHHSRPAPPKVEKKPEKSVHHGITRIDNYAWLKVSNWYDVLKDPSLLDRNIRRHLEAENTYQKKLMADTKALQKKLFAEMKARIKEDDSSVPVKDGPYAYGISFTTGGEQPQYFRTPREGGNKLIYLDGDKEASGKAFFQLGSTNYSPNHKKFVWSYDDMGSELYTMHVREFEGMKDLPDILTDTAGDGIWDAASEGFFYTRMDANNRPSQLYYHRLGTHQDEDRLVFREDDPGFFITVQGSRLNDFIFIDTHDHETSEIWLIPANKPLTKPRRVKKRQQGIEYHIMPGGDIFYIRTNQDGARDFKIMTTPVQSFTPENWQEFIPHEEGRLLLSHDVYEKHLVWLERKEGLPRIIIMDRKAGTAGTIAFDEEAYSLALIGASEYKTDIVRFSYSSMKTPDQIIDYNMADGTRTLLKTLEVPSGYDSSNYITHRLMAPTEDSELVPVSLLYHKNTPLDGSAPCLLYGYGAYGITIPASFDSDIFSLVDRGFVYAIAHTRGGEDKGFAWYETGKHKHKHNTFHDFIATGRYLVQKGFTSHDRLIAYGGSAGGMLLGAVANMAPQDFGGIIATVPFVDVLTTMLDAALPLTPPEWPEWGNPITSVEDYKLIASYSPYDNVKKQAYPHILAIGGLTDPRVTYWEPAKWVARLREMKTDNNPVLLRINMGAGHAGATGRFSQLEETAYTYAFALKITGKM